MKKTKKSTGKSILLVNLKKQYLSIKDEIDHAVARVLKSGWYLLGTELEKFEVDFATYIGTKFAIGVASGTDALTLGVKALGLGKGDGVVVAANVYPTSFGLAHSGIKLQLSDVDPSTMNIDLQNIEKVVDSTTKAIVLVHLYGNAVDLMPIIRFAKKRKIYLIEDCAQAIGTEYQGRKVGSFGDVACFSFYPTKNLGAYGDAGMITTNNKMFAKRIKLWRMYGEKSKYKSLLVGHNSRLDEIQAAILKVHLKHVDNWNNKRRKLFKIYQQELKNLEVQLLDYQTSGGNLHLFCILIKKRHQLLRYLVSNNVQAAIHYPTPIHLTPSFKYLGYKKGDFPISEKASQEIISLPMHPFLTVDEVKRVCNLIKEFI